VRPVNLIPPEDRRGDRAPLRSGPLAYAVVGTLAVVLVAVLALVLTQNGVNEKEAELAQLEADLAAATARAETLRPYAEFAALEQAREGTITSLARSRFDWERVLRELSLVIPANVTLLTLEGSAGGVDGSAAVETEGPTLTASGCAANHRAVADFVAALEDIDGVTRVGLTQTAKATDEGAEDCGDANLYALSLAFDHAVPGAIAEVPASSPPTTPAPAGAEANAAQVENSKKAANLVPGVSR
jgi:Tfp pilus assembly protein PilN